MRNLRAKAALFFLKVGPGCVLQAIFQSELLFPATYFLILDG